MTNPQGVTTQEPLIAALAAAGVPSEQARSVAANWLLSPGEEIADADDMDRLMIATDAPRILRVLLEARLRELSVRGENREVDLSEAGVGYDGDCPVTRLLDLLAPEVRDA